MASSPWWVASTFHCRRHACQRCWPRRTGVTHKGWSELCTICDATSSCLARSSVITSTLVSSASRTRWNSSVQAACCNRLKYEVPSVVWADIAIDFVEGFSRINGKSIILTVEDRFFKFTNFIRLGHPYMATSVARVFFTDIVRLHGLPSSIVSDRDPVFTSKFWQELFTLTGVKLNLSLAIHPQSDDQFEVANKVITMYLHCFAGDRLRQWLQWLLWAEYCYNTAFHSSLKTMPFSVVHGRDPSCLLLYDTGTRLPAVHHQLQERDKFLLQIRERLEQAQHQYKEQYDPKNGSGFASTGQWLLLTSRAGANSGQNSMARSRYSSAWAM
jgi:hypothetical protein